MTQQPNGDYHSDFLESYVVGAAIGLEESHQYMAVYLPNPAKHPKPVNGYPVILGTSFAGFATSTYGTIIPYTVPSVEQFRYLEELGVAFVWAGMTGAYDYPGGPLNTTSVGRGLFHPPGTAGWDDELRYYGQKDACLIVQKTREQAATWGIDPDRIMVEGGSAGAVAFACPLLWEDQADISKTDHRKFSTRVLAAKFEIWQTDFRIYDPSVSAPANFNMFPDAAGDMINDIAATYNDAPAGYLEWTSAIAAGFGDEDSRARNARGIHIFHHHHGAGEHMTDMTLTGTWGPSTGKSPNDPGSVDANDTDAFHEVGSGVLFAQVLRETEEDEWHIKHSKMYLDAAAYSNAVSVYSPVAGILDAIHAGTQIDDTRFESEAEWIKEVFALNPVEEKVEPVDFFFEPEWSTPPTVKFAKDLKVFESEMGKQTRTSQMQRFETVRHYTVAYLTSNKFEARAFEHALAANAGGLFRIPFYPEVMTASAADFQGQNIVYADQPDWGYPAYGPAANGDVVITNPYPPISGSFYMPGDWYIGRIDTADWSNSESRSAFVLAGSKNSLLILTTETFSNTIQLSRQSMAWMDRVMLVGTPRLDHLTDTQTLYTVNWRSV